MIRRQIVLTLGVSLACLSFPAFAQGQQPTTPRRVGVLLVSWGPDSRIAQAFREGLRDRGYTEGRDVVIEWRTPSGDYDRVPQLAADLVKSKVDVIVVDGTVGTRALKQATSTIPIVMALVADPVGSGLVANLAHPGGNITGFTIMIPDLSAKQLQLLKEAVPRLGRVTVLWNPNTPYSAKVLGELKAAASSLSIELKFVGARRPEEITAALSAESRAHAEALYVIEDPLFTTHRTTILKLASKARVPTMYGGRHWVEGGGLISYGANYDDLARRSAEYVDRILKGAQPADLPIEQPTQFKLVVNPKAARALGLTFPESILVRADEVIR